MLDDRGDKMLGEYHNVCSKRFLWFWWINNWSPRYFALAGILQS
jgi:hypothetical protein